MDNLLKFLVARPFLALWGFVKRHPGKTAFVLFLLLVVPQVLQLAGWLCGQVFSFVGKVKALQKVNEAAFQAATKFFVWITAKPGRKWLVGWLVVTVAPLPGWILLAWLVADRLKADPDKITVNIQAPKG